MATGALSRRGLPDLSAARVVYGSLVRAQLPSVYSAIRPRQVVLQLPGYRPGRRGGCGHCGSIREARPSIHRMIIYGDRMPARPGAG